MERSRGGEQVPLEDLFNCNTSHTLSLSLVPSLSLSLSLSPSLFLSHTQTLNDFSEVNKTIK